VKVARTVLRRATLGNRCRLSDINELVIMSANGTEPKFGKERIAVIVIG